MRRGRLERRTRLAPGGPLQRTPFRGQPNPLRSVHPSRPRIHADPVWAAVRALIWARACGRCERCGRLLDPHGWDGHHRKLRSQGGQHSAANAVALCPDCHTAAPDAVHRRRAVARLAGWIVHPSADPATVPVQLHNGRRVWLDAGGGYSENPPDLTEETRAA